MSKGLTRRQKQILNYVASEVENKGYPPSVREIGSAVGLSSSSTVHSHLTALEKKGFIKRDPSKPRALLLPNRRKTIDSGAVAVPVVGRVAAGQPALAVESVDYRVAWPDNIGPAPTFALQVKGDSMIDEGILEGDIVMVRQQSTADNGEIVVALIDDEATVKRFYREPGYIRLQPANPAYEPIITREAQIVGKVVGLLRKF